MTFPIAFPAPRVALGRRSLLGLLLPATLLFLTGCEGTIGSPPDLDSSSSSGGAGGANVAAAGVGGGSDPVTGSGGAGGAGTSAGGAGGAGGSDGPHWEPVQTDWCQPDWIGLDEHTCFFVPDKLASPASVLFFAHGMMPPDASTKSQQDLARKAAQAHGFIAVFPRGRQGLCAWDASVADWWCWPTSRTAVDDNAADILDEWRDAQILLEEIQGLTFERTFVLGFSNGGYFASYIGLEGLLETTGVGVVGAGRSYVDESLMPPQSTPFYIAVGDQEPDSTQNGAANLAFVLKKHDWPNKLVIHAGQGHMISSGDFDGACAVWGL